jgi:Bifunctional DNA primase/polymerase, N-terminal/Primase C terminal 2 (PriCT-2)
MTPLDAARGYVTRGWRVVPIPFGEKGPRAPGWDKLDLGLGDLPRHFCGDCNLGVRLGHMSGELIDLDLDCPEALALADRYLPPTQAEFGRQSKPRSHRLFVAAGAVYESFADPLSDKKNTLLELRASGRDGGAHQTLFPPSIADGERREWRGNIIAPAVIAAAGLRTAAAWLAIGALVRRYVSVHASERPGPDLPDLLAEADPALGKAAQRWLRLPERNARGAQLRPRREMSADEIDLAELIASIPNNADWEMWNNTGLAIYSVTSGSDHGAVLFDDWSAKSAKYNPYVTTERWHHYHRSPPSRTGIGKLISLAMAAGWRPDRKEAGAQ